MTRAVFAAAAYGASSLALTFANKFVMQILRDPFTLLLSQVVITLTFSFCAFCCLKLQGFNTFFNIQKAGWFVAIGFSSFIGWAASLEGLKSGSVATLTMIKAVNPILAATLAKFFLPSSEPHHLNSRLAWVVLSGVGCCFYVYDRATADYRACFFFFVSVLSASVNTITLKRMQLHSLLPSDALSSVICSSAFINAAALPFIFIAFLETVTSDVTIQVATLLCTPISLCALILSLCSTIAISFSGYLTQRVLSATTYIVFINSCKIPTVIISMLMGQDGCVSCSYMQIFGFILWIVGSGRFLYLSTEIDGRSVLPLLQFQKFSKQSKILSATKICAVALSFVFLLTAFQSISSKIYHPTHHPVRSSYSSLQSFYESAAGPDPRILTGLPVYPTVVQRSACGGPIRFEHSQLTHSLYDAAVKVSPGLEFALGISNTTLKSWRECSLNALQNARNYYANMGGGVLPENISNLPYHACPKLHKAVAPVILKAINSFANILTFFGQDVIIKKRYCFEISGRSTVNPSKKLIEWRTFLRDKVHRIAPDKYTARKRGYVFAGSSKHNLLMARSIVDLMRAHGSIHPAEFWIDPVDEDSPQISTDDCQQAFVLSGLECRYMCQISEVQMYFPLCHPNWGYSPYQAKLIAIQYSSFEQVFFLDNDVVPLKSMDFMFSAPQFVKYGAIFWAEALPAQPAFPWGPDVAEAIGVNWSHPVPHEYVQYLSALCSAQIMIDKRKFWQELSLATYLNLDTTFYYRVMHGDKDIFAAAWLALGSRWYLIQASGVAGYSCKMQGGKCVASLHHSGPDNRVCGTEWLRYDTEGRPLLMHHTKHMDSMTMFESGKIDTSWQLIVEHTNTLNPVAAGITGGGFSTKMEVADRSKQRSLSSGWHCLELEAKQNVIIKQAPTSIGNVQWLFYLVVSRNFGRPLHLPLDSVKCTHAPKDAGFMFMDKDMRYRYDADISVDDVRPKFLGMRVPCLCLFLVGKMSDPKTICLDHPMRPPCVVYDLGVQNERMFASSMRRLGCDVHSYDPTMHGVSKQDWFEATGGEFHDVVVANFNGFVEGIGKVQTVASMMTENAHKVIDFLKIDVESFEWDTLFEMHSAGTLERVGAIQMEVHFWNKACFAHWVEWEAIWSKLGYPPESSDTRACTTKNAKGSAATIKDILIWQRALDLLRDSGFLQSSLQVVGGGQMVEFPNGEVLPCCYEINLVKPNWNLNNLSSL